MAYTIKLSDGSVLLTLPDQSINKTNTSVALVGRGAVNYGTDFAQNFVWMLENFANIKPPTCPLVGQLWFDTSTQILRAWIGSRWRPAVGDISSDAIPNTLALRDANGDFKARVISAELNGNAGSASKWQTPRRLTLNGNARGDVVWDGATDVVLNVTVDEAAHAARATLADGFATARNITLSGDVSGGAQITGTGDTTIGVTLVERGTSNNEGNRMVLRNAEGGFAAAYIYTEVRGNASTASKLAQGRNIVISGAANGGANFDGSGDINIGLTLSDTGVQPGTYTSVTVDSKGRITGGTTGQGTVERASVATRAETADRATTATSADTASKATLADRATKADTATVADRLSYGYALYFSGDASGGAPFDATKDTALPLTLADTGVTAGNYTNANIQVDSKGRIISASNGTGGGTGGGGGGGTITGGTNVGGGQQVLRSIDSNDMKFRTLVAGANIGITTSGDTIVITGAGGSGGTDTNIKVKESEHSDTSSHAEYADGAGVAQFADTARALDPNLRIDTVFIKPLAVHQVTYQYQITDAGQPYLTKQAIYDPARPATIQVLPTDYSGWQTIIDMPFDSSQYYLRLTNFEVNADQRGENSNIQSFFQIKQVFTNGTTQVTQQTVGLYPFVTSDGWARKYFTDTTNLGDGTARYQLQVCSLANSGYQGRPVRWVNCYLSVLTMKR